MPPPITAEYLIGLAKSQQDRRASIAANAAARAAATAVPPLEPMVWEWLRGLVRDRPAYVAQRLGTTVEAVAALVTAGGEGTSFAAAEVATVVHAAMAVAEAAKDAEAREAWDG